jgi:tryptophan halogenase
MIGQGITPDQYHPIVDEMSQQELADFLSSIKNGIERTVEKLPPHKDYIQQYCKADNM